MYFSLLVIHNTLRWIALMALFYSIYIALTGYRSSRVFSPADNAFRHWTATILQVQMTIGIILYFNSPLVHSIPFFNVIHPVLMLVAVVIISIGSAVAKRKQTDHEKFKTMLTWFVTCLLIILVAIPWPFSPLTQRPYFRLI